MTKVYEALKRQKQDRADKNESRDPLAAQTGAPDVSLDNNDPGIDLNPVIGAPLNASGANNNHSHASSSDAAAYRTLKQTRAYAPAVDLPQDEYLKQQNENRHKQNMHGVDETLFVERERREIVCERISSNRLHPRLILVTEPHAQECEQYRTLRTQLFHATEKNRTQVVVVTSALAGEGKTSTVLNLALAIAQSKEKRILLIDGDLRRPNVASFLGLQPKTGLGEILRGEHEVLSSIFCLEGIDLYLLPVCQEANNPTELLSSERFGETIALLREYFDFILFDSPPVMPFADSRLLANHADAVILVVRAGMAPYETVEKAIDALPRERILGVVLNGAEHIREAGYYDYYYNYARREQKRSTITEKVKTMISRSRIGRKMQ
ncbi:MAG: CpsD/CapB family tyrosine-protein kinase [Acidobacteria bacterium]|nr:CpsD/CapB family tyrosine-protein kinase [Acidobacteriota bacterium]